MQLQPSIMMDGDCREQFAWNPNVVIKLHKQTLGRGKYFRNILLNDKSCTEITLPATFPYSVEDVLNYLRFAYYGVPNRIKTILDASSNWLVFHKDLKYRKDA